MVDIIVQRLQDYPLVMLRNRVSSVMMDWHGHIPHWNLVRAQEGELFSTDEMVKARSSNHLVFIIRATSSLPLLGSKEAPVHQQTATSLKPDVPLFDAMAVLEDVQSRTGKLLGIKNLERHSDKWPETVFPVGPQLTSHCCSFSA